MPMAAIPRVKSPPDLESGGEAQQPKFSKSRRSESDLVLRTALLDWLSAHEAEPVVTIFAPAGYGKTTLLAQAAEADPRPFASISVEHGDNDPVVLMTHLAETLDLVATVGSAVFD